jgi:hypothetical protein
MSIPSPEEIMEKWRFVNLSRTAIVLIDNADPGYTAKVLRDGRNDVAFLYNEVVGLRQELARAEGELAGLKAR